jgi:hypothetical protein
MTIVEREIFPETGTMAYALGWVVHNYRGETVISHTGVIDGFRCQISLMPARKLAVAVCVNVHATRINSAIINQIFDDELKPAIKRDWSVFYLQKLEEELKQRNWRYEELSKSKKILELVEDRYLGKYFHPAYGELELIVRDEKMRLRWRDYDAPLYVTDGQEMLWWDQLTGRHPLKFEVRDGVVTGLQLFEVPFVKRP